MYVTAAQEGHEGVARLLLASGADPNRADGCGRTALKVKSHITYRLTTVKDLILNDGKFFLNVPVGHERRSQKSDPAVGKLVEYFLEVIRYRLEIFVRQRSRSHHQGLQSCLHIRDGCKLFPPTTILYTIKLCNRNKFLLF